MTIKNMEVMKSIKAWYNKVVTDAKQKKASHKADALQAESRKALQVMEFNGELFLCFRGTPILREDQLMATLPEALEESRDTFVDFVTDQDV